MRCPGTFALTPVLFRVPQSSRSLRLAQGVSSFVTDAPVVWDASGGNPVRILRSFGGKVVLLEATHSGEKVAVVDDYAGVHLWDASTWVLHRLDAPGARSPIQSFDISHSGALVVGKWWSTVFVWSGTTGLRCDVGGPRNQVESVSRLGEQVLPKCPERVPRVRRDTSSCRESSERVSGFSNNSTEFVLTCRNWWFPIMFQFVL